MKLLRGRDSGAAVVEFSLILMLLVPIFLGVLHVGLASHVKNTMTACASEGARFGAQYDRAADDGAVRARECIDTALSSRYSGNVWATTGSADGQEMVIINGSASMPLVGFGPDSWDIDVSGHAVKETLPG